MRTFFISDTHFYHENIIEYCKRPFSSVREMNDSMIERWNAVVTPDDRVIHGGDFALCSQYAASEIFKKLNGAKYLVRGNHDGTVTRMKSIGFVDATNYWFEDGILVHHTPYNAPADLHNECDVFLHGHVHEKPSFQPKGINISVERIDYTPRTIDELKEMFPDNL